MLIKKISAAVMCAAVLTAGLSACGKKTETSGNATPVKDSSSSEPAQNSDTQILNFTKPEIGEEIVTLKIKDYGDIKIKLFPELVPKAVENFVGLTKQGYYDGLIFHRIINNFMIQGGDPKGNGTGGSSIWGEKFDGGTSPNLCHAAGAIAYANSGSTDTDGSQFYIVTGKVYPQEELSVLDEELQEIYSTVGGTPWLDGGYTVFGQVIDGLDIVFELQQVETGANDKPTKAVVIESATVEEYNGEDVKWYISDYAE